MYGKIHGKQVKDSTVDLLKVDLSGNQGMFIFASGSYLGAYEVPNNPNAYITKQYADSLSAGLDPKESVYLVSTYNISPSGIVNVDGTNTTSGSRVLLVGQTNTIENGIYLAGPTAWSRATDSNSNPVGEVSLGNYTFVERGVTYSSTGWILYDTDATGSTVSVGTNTQLWTQFNGAGSFIWGNGIGNIGNNIYVDLDPSGGLTFSGGAQLKIADYVAGAGLTINSGVLAVGVGTGISVAPDSISINFTEAATGLAGNGLNSNGTVIDVTAGTGITTVGDSVAIADTTVSPGTYGTTGSVSSFTVNQQGQLTTASTILISITSDQVSNFTSSVQSLATQVSAGTGITISSSIGSATVSISNTGVSAGSYGTSNSVNTFTVNAQGQLTTVATSSISITSGQVSNFTASISNIVNADLLQGNGLSASGGVINIIGGTAIGVESDGVYVKYDPTTIGIDVNGALTVISAGDAILDIVAGKGITGNQLSGPTASLDVELTANGGLTFSNSLPAATIEVDYISVATKLAGSGLVQNGTSIDISLAKGVTFSGDSLFADASTILTTGNLSTINIGTNSTIQAALTSIDNYLTNVGLQEEISINNSPTGTFLKSANLPVDVLGYTFTTPSDGSPHIYVNGVYVKTTSSTASSAAYFSTDGGVTGNTNVISNSVLYMNPYILDYKLDPTDIIVVHYLTKTN